MFCEFDQKLCTYLMNTLSEERDAAIEVMIARIEELLTQHVSRGGPLVGLLWIGGWGHHKNSLEALQGILGGLKRAEVKHEAKTAEVSTADDGA